MTINIEPTKDIPPPYDLTDSQTSSFVEELAVVSNTQDVLEQLGPPPEMDKEDAIKTASLLESAVKKQDKGALSLPPVAFAAREFLRVYSSRIAAEMSDVRAALTNKLLELANCGDPRFELKALELLGKHSDISLFTERSEVTVTYKNSSDLEDAIKERVKRLLNAKDITPEHAVNADNLDDVLGVVDMGTPVEVDKEQTDEIKPNE
jgi:hypothetical protein